VRFLTPTGNKRFNELVGFLCITLGGADRAGVAFVFPEGRGVLT